jgi:tellurite resistance protein
VGCDLRVVLGKQVGKEQQVSKAYKTIARRSSEIISQERERKVLFIKARKKLTGQQGGARDI